LSAYEQGSVAYIEGAIRPVVHEDFLDSIVALLPGEAHMLELGSGPADDALFFEGRGVRVSRTDGAARRRLRPDRRRVQRRSKPWLYVLCRRLQG
jgi:hypothetical protein